jgi:hypothetical protein
VGRMWVHTGPYGLGFLRGPLERVHGLLCGPLSPGDPHPAERGVTSRACGSEAEGQ